MQGLIALDIDGTTTVPGHEISLEVIDYLKELSKEYAILFITGRSFHGSQVLLSVLPFPYYLAVQNGSIIIEMPSKQIVSKKYLNRDIFQKMEIICEGEPTDFVIFSGFENQDVSYYRPHHFSVEMREYVLRRAHTYREVWKSVHSFEEMDLLEFPSIKCFGDNKSANDVAQRIVEQLGLHVPVIRDPFHENYYVVQATNPEVSKGYALRTLAKIIHYRGPIIAAGDDYNDITMLSQADIKIVMSSAPEDMLLKADIIAPPAEKQGIIAGLKLAIKNAKLVNQLSSLKLSDIASEANIKISQSSSNKLSLQYGAFDSCTCVGLNNVNISYMTRNSHVDMLVKIENEFLGGERDNDIEVTLLFDVTALLKHSVDGCPATVFYLGNEIILETEEKRIKLLFSLEEGSGTFVGHFSKGSRASEFPTQTPLRTPLCDWVLFLRTLRRTPRCLIRISIDITPHA